MSGVWLTVEGRRYILGTEEAWSLLRALLTVLAQPDTRERGAE